MATGRKTVAPGQTIASEWGNLVWDQSVQDFASAADRTTQFPAPKPGNMTWLEDVKRLEIWSGTAWLDAQRRPYTAGTPVAWGGGTGSWYPWTLTSVDTDTTGTLNLVAGNGFQVTRAGLCLVTFVMAISGTLTGNVLAVRLNDTTSLGEVPANNARPTLTILTKVAANDKLAPWVTLVSGASGGGGTSWFSIAYLGARA